MKAQGFLESVAAEIVETTDAAKNRKGRDEALKLAHTVERVVVGRGKKVRVFEMKTLADEDELIAAMLGPTGNLKAPTLRLGGTLLVGFSEEAYRQVLAS